MEEEMRFRNVFLVCLVVMVASCTTVVEKPVVQTVVVEKEVVVEKPVVQTVVVEKEKIVEKPVVQTVVVEKEVVVEKPVVQTVVVEKEKIVEKPVVQTVVVKKEVPVTVEVIKEVVVEKVVTPTPTFGFIRTVLLWPDGSPFSGDVTSLRVILRQVTGEQKECGLEECESTTGRTEVELWAEPDFWKKYWVESNPATVWLKTDATMEVKFVLGKIETRPTSTPRPSPRSPTPTPYPPLPTPTPIHW